MRRRLSIALLLMISIGFIGCSSSEDSAPETVPETTDGDYREVPPEDFGTDPVAIAAQDFIDCTMHGDADGAFACFTPKARAALTAANMNLTKALDGSTLSIQTVRYLPDGEGAQAGLLSLDVDPMTNMDIQRDAFLGLRRTEDEGWRIAAVGVCIYEELGFILLDLENPVAAEQALREGLQKAALYQEELFAEPETEEPVVEEVQVEPVVEEETEEVEEQTSPVAPLPEPVDSPIDPPAPRTSAYPPLEPPVEIPVL